ncbi:MAG: DUF2779 domain-containing protein [Gemmatimonadota bacterium]|nr:MAG: DUF2779 domain-containing protein [Gemmatimonadota bacterium]
MSEAAGTRYLSKSRFVAGWQCPALLWRKVHEPEAPELVPDKVLQDRFDQGTHVGEVARERFAGGVLIDIPHGDFHGRIAATQAAIAGGAPAIFEASFLADSVFVAVDVLERTGDGFNLIEVKSSTSQKDEHICDAAIQVYVLRRSGFDVTRAEIMHLNKEHRHPDQGDLFRRTDVSDPVEGLLPLVPEEVCKQLDVISGPLPEVELGPHCFEPHRCPFINRCWPDVENHISTLYQAGPKKAWQYISEGINTIADIPADRKLSAPARRQVRALQLGEMIVEPGLARDLEPFSGRLGYLDFETVSRAIPVWPGLGPWHQATAQFSYHEEAGSGGLSHVGWLAEGPDDPRPELARVLVEATAAAEKVVMYSPFERRCIRDLQKVVPELETELRQLEGKLIDLLPVIRNNVYHPDFQGSFSIKYVLSPLVPELSYNDLVIVDGMAASVEIARLLFVAQKIAPEERDRLRHDLLEYCKRDTEAMVKLLEALRKLAA